MRILLTGSKSQLARCLRDRLPEDWETIATDSASLDITDADAVCNMVKVSNPTLLSTRLPILPSTKRKAMRQRHLPSMLPPFTTLPWQHIAPMPDSSTSQPTISLTVKGKGPIRKATLPILPMYTDNPKPQASCSHCSPIPTALSCGLLGCLANTGTTLSARC